jgi:2-hydroxy-6-oxonona-2,4-dienedioate hydrolase
VRKIEGRYRTRIIEAGVGSHLLLLHGTGGHAENYVRNIGRLSKHFHVVAPDFIWHGRSQTEGFDAEIVPSLVDQLVDIVDTLGIDAAAVEGQSMGGWIAMQLALRHPGRVKALILTTTQGYVADADSIEGYVEPDLAANIPNDLDMLREPTFDKVRIRMARIVADPASLPDEAVEVRLDSAVEHDRVVLEFLHRSCS